MPYAGRQDIRLFIDAQIVGRLDSELDVIIVMQIRPGLVICENHFKDFLGSAFQRSLTSDFKF